MKKQARLFLVGAGPGDSDLLTIKGLKVLQKADVILYDSLVNEELISHATQATVIKKVGKTSGNHSYQQEEINRLIVEYAQTYRNIVRLKGGDPFVFGRGIEEIEYARQHGIETAVVIGVSSINLAGHFQIPLTQRGLNESFWVVTACNKDHTLSQDLQYVAQSSATAVILMGLKKLSNIVSLYKALQKEDYPIIIISKGSTRFSQICGGRIDDIEQKVLQKNMSTPAIILIGKALHKYANDEYAEQIIQKLYSQNIITN